MNGNPHYEPNCTVNSFYELEGAYHHNEAMLAIAFEQRTANLIALVPLANTESQATLLELVRNRMGLTQ